MFSNVSSIDLIMLKFVLTLYSRSQIISPLDRLDADDGNEENGTTRGFASGLSLSRQRS